MHANHILLGHPWQYDRKVTHDGYRNVYEFLRNDRHVVLTPLNPLEAHKDQLKITEECKMRENTMRALDKENNESLQERGKNSETKTYSENMNQNRGKNMRLSSFSIKSEIKRTCFSTNHPHSSLHSENFYLVQELNSRMNPFQEGENVRNMLAPAPFKFNKKI